MSTLILQKNQTSDLVSDKGTPVLDMSVGVNWGMINSLGQSKAAGFLGKLATVVGVESAVKTAVDLDLSMVFVDQSGDIIDICYFGKKRLWNGAVNHTGDDLTGDEEQDDSDNEIIQLRGLQIPPHVQQVFVVLNSYRHQKFDEIPYIGINFYEGIVNMSDKGLRFAEFSMTNDKSFAGKECCILARLDRTLKGFSCTILGDCTDDTSLRALAATAVAKHRS